MGLVRVSSYWNTPQAFRRIVQDAFCDGQEWAAFSEIVINVQLFTVNAMYYHVYFVTLSKAADFSTYATYAEPKEIRDIIKHD